MNTKKACVSPQIQVEVLNVTDTTNNTYDSVHVMNTSVLDA